MDMSQILEMLEKIRDVGDVSERNLRVVEKISKKISGLLGCQRKSQNCIHVWVFWPNCRALDSKSLQGSCKIN